MPANEPSQQHHLAARAGKPVRSNSTAENRRPPQSRGQPQEPSGCLTGVGRRQRIENLFDFSASVRVDLQPDGNLDNDRSLPLHGHFFRAGFCLVQPKSMVEPCQLEALGIEGLGRGERFIVGDRL
jgi:hypothetical protein